MAGTMDKIKAKVDNVLHKDKDTTHTGTTGTHHDTTGTHTGSGLTGSTHSEWFLHITSVAITNYPRRPHRSLQLARC